MTCYFHHIEAIFREATVEVVPGVEDEIDEFIRELTRVKQGGCPDVWRTLRPWTENSHMREMLVLALRDEFGQR